MNTATRNMIKNQFKNIDIEQLKQDNVMYSIFLIDTIRRLDNFCEMYKQDKTEAYLNLSRLLKL